MEDKIIKNGKVAYVGLNDSEIDFELLGFEPYDPVLVSMIVNKDYKQLAKHFTKKAKRKYGKEFDLISEKVVEDAFYLLWLDQKKMYVKIKHPDYYGYYMLVLATK